MAAASLMKGAGRSLRVAIPKAWNIPCLHPGCQEHPLELSKGCLVPPPLNCKWYFNEENPLEVGSHTGSSSTLEYARGMLKFPPDEFRPRKFRALYYGGRHTCPIVDDTTAIFELHCYGPFLDERRTLLRKKILATQAFADGSYETALIDGFKSLNELLATRAPTRMPPTERGQMYESWACGSFSLAVIVKNNLIYTGGAGARCCVYHPANKEFITYPRKYFDARLIANLNRRGAKTLESDKEYFISPASELNKLLLGNAESLFLEGLDKGWGARDICLHILNYNGMKSIRLDSPLVVARIK